MICTSDACSSVAPVATSRRAIRSWSTMSTYVVSPARPPDRGLRHRHSPRHLAQHDPPGGVQAAHETPVAVRHRHVDLHLAGRGIDGGIDARHAAAQTRAGRARHRQHHRGSHVDVGGVLARHRGGELQLRRVDELKQQVAILHPIARIDRALTDHAARRGTHRGLIELLPCQGLIGLGGAQAHLGVLDVPLRDRALLEEVLHALVVRGGQPALGLSGERGRLDRAAPEPRQRLSGAHRFALADEHRFHHFRNRRCDPHHDRRIERPRHRHAGDQIDACGTCQVASAKLDGVP